MNREPWVVYLIVIGIVIVIMYGKYLMTNNNKKDKK